MAIHDVFDGALLIASAMDILSRHEVSVTVGEDMEEYRALLAEYRPEQPLGPPFDPQLNDISASNAFWIVGRDPTGRVVHTQAMRLIDLQGQTLESYLREGFRAFPPAAVDLDMQRSRYRAGPGAGRITGRVCYHGEVWLRPDPAYRGTGLSCVLGRFAFMTAVLRWMPDYVFGFMPRGVAFKGFAERQGYMHAEPGVLRWVPRDSDKVLEGFMVWMSREDIRYVMGMPLNELVA